MPITPSSLPPAPLPPIERSASRAGQPVTIGLLGCGTVGGGILELLTRHREYLSERAFAPLVVKKILVRDLAKPRVEACDRAALTTSADDILDDPAIDLVVEVMGGEGAGPYVEKALQRGKSVVTANKLLLALRGPALLELARQKRVDLAFEGAVGGGIPIVRTLREAFASDSVTSVTAIINGTCNYILTRMREEGASFGDALKEAQELGYAEAEPSLDVDGHDAAHKLVLLAMLAFGASVAIEDIHCEGIRSIDERDHLYAGRFGYAIKHLAIGRDRGRDVELRVHPTLVPSRSVLANVSGVLNAVLLHGKALGPCLVYGRGAGDLPTAVSVVADILDVARSIVAGVAGLQTRGIALGQRPLCPPAEFSSRYYVRLSVQDRPKVMAAVTRALGDAEVSIEQIVQQPKQGDPEDCVDIVMITHRADEGALRKALSEIEKESFLRKPVRVFRIEDA